MTRRPGSPLVRQGRGAVAVALAAVVFLLNGAGNSLAFQGLPVPGLPGPGVSGPGAVPPPPGPQPVRPPVPAVTVTPSLIVPGRSLGPARLGMHPAELSAVLGSSTRAPNGQRYYPRWGLTVAFDGETAFKIGTAGARYRTAGGAGIGATIDAVPRQLGDVNSVATTSGVETTIRFAFRGIGFVFRGGRAVWVFIEEPIPFGPQVAPAPGAPAGPAFIPGGPAIPGIPAPGASGAAPAGATSIAIRDVTLQIPAAGGVTVSGTVVNTGAGSTGPLEVIGTFTRAAGDETVLRASVGPIAPGGQAPFMLRAAMVSDIIVRYAVGVTAGGAVVATSPPQPVPATAYAAFARGQIHIKKDMGAPANAGGGVQVLLSIQDTGAVPVQWVRQVTVDLPYATAGFTQTQTVTLAPGETQTVIVPSTASVGPPQVRDVVIIAQ